MMSSESVSTTASATAGLTSTVYSPPQNAIRIPAGANIQSYVDSQPAGTAFLLSEGTYSGQTISPRSGDSFYGENGKAVLDGNGAQHAFLGQGVSDVVLSGLVIENYAPPDQGIGALGTDGSSVNWTVQDCDLTGITNGSPIMLGTNMTVVDNSIHDNQMAGIASWNVSGGVIEHNEIWNNNLSGNSPYTATGEGAGIKLAQSTGVTIDDNYIHNNDAAPGIWTDSSSQGTEISGNWIAGNGAPGIIDELDYGATITNNLVENNNNPALGGYGGGGIYVQNSQNAVVSDNTLSGNDGGVWVYQSDRGSGTQGPWVVSNDKVSGNTIQMSAGQNGYGGTVAPGSVTWTDNAYYVSGSGQFMAGNQAESFSAWQASGQDSAASGSTFSTSATLPGSGGGTGTGGTGTGGGTGGNADTLAVRVSEDAWNGNAQFTVAVDGQQVGGTYTADALHSAGASDVVHLTGDWGSGSHDVKLSFLNDAYNGTAETDRNLYVNSISLDGTTYAGTSAAMMTNGAQSFSIGGNDPTTSAPADQFTLGLSEDAWQGNAEFVVSVDGKQISAPQEVTALHSAGQLQNFQFAGDFGAGQHAVSVSFVNDAYGGSPSADRNLYVGASTFNGESVAQGTTTLDANGSTSFTVTTTH